MSLIENKSLTLAENDQFIRAVSVVSTQLNTKAQLGAVVQSFDPDAIDGDGDGMVQDGSPFERPAVISAMTSAAQRLGKIIGLSGQYNRRGKAKEYHRRHSGKSAKDITIDSVPANFNEWAALTYERLKIAEPSLPELNSDTTPEDLKEIVERLQAFVEPDLLWLLSQEDAAKYIAGKLINKNKAFSELVDNAFDFSPKTVAKNRELIEHVLTTNPQFRELVNRWGMPPVFGFGSNLTNESGSQGFLSDRLGMGLDKFRNPKSKGRFDFASRAIGAWIGKSLLSPPVHSKKTKRWSTRSGSPEVLFIHEYGHHLSEVMKLELTNLDINERNTKWQAWRFSAGDNWERTFKDIGSPDWFKEYKKDRTDATDVPQVIPHIETAYGESSPAEAWAESISATFAHDGIDDHLISDGMKELIADFLSLDPKRDTREQLTPKRAAREIIPDGFASRGAVVEINKERDARYGDVENIDYLADLLLGHFGDDEFIDNPVQEMVKRSQDILNDPKQFEEWAKLGRIHEIEDILNIRAGNDEERELLTSVLRTNPAFADMIRRHGTSQIYFSKDDLRAGPDRHDVRGVLRGGFVADDSPSGKYWPPHVVVDLVGASHERNLPDEPMGPARDLKKMKEYSKGRAPGNITRTHVSRSDQHVIRHETGHAIHDNLWERQHRGEITGQRAALIRAYSKSTWEEFYTELGRPDLWREHQRAIGGNPKSNRLFGFFGSDKTASPEIGQVDSAYAWFNPKEMFAESFSAYTSSNPAFRGLLNDTMVDHLQSMLGDADNDIPNPPSMPESRDLNADIPEPPPWEGFASVGEGEPPKSYGELRRKWVGAISGNELFTRSEFFQNTTTDQKVDLAVPTNEGEWALMAWDQMFQHLGLSWDQVDAIDLSDPFNPTLRDDEEIILGARSFFGGRITIGGNNFAETLDLLEYQGFLLKKDAPDFSPEVVKVNRDALRASLDAFPRLREASERYGLPPITTMTASSLDRLNLESDLDQILKEWKSGTQINEKFDAVMIPYMKYSQGNSQWQDFIENPAVKDLLAEWKPTSDVAGGYYGPNQTISLSKALVDGFVDGTRVDHKYTPTAGDWLVAGDSFENTLLHEYAHYMDRSYLLRTEDEKEIEKEIEKLFENVEDHIKTIYGRSERNEFVAEIVAAVLSGSRDQEEMLSPEARQVARRIAGLPERDPVFAGRIPSRKPAAFEVVADRFGELWQRTPDGLMEPLDKERGLRSRDGVPDVLETMMDAKLRTGLSEFPPVEFEHSGRTFAIREVGDTFEIEINGRTVARANVTPGKDGLPEIDNVDVLPGYGGVAPDQDLHEMIVDHARKKYPSARAPRRARQTEVVSEGFASIGPEHHDARGIDGTPGTPEYTQAIAGELAAAQAEGKKVFFDYNGETREVTVTEIFEKNGFTYMKGNDALRDGAERMFRLDRVSMPKRVENPETGKAEIAKLPGKKPRRPVPVFTGKAAEIFEGAESWEDVAARLGKGRYVFFDFETTGIEENPYSVDYNHPGTPTQIGLVEINDGEITRRWATHVNPGRPMSIDPKTGRSWSADNLKYRDPDTGELVNLTDEWLTQQKPLNEALEEMLEFIGPIGDTILGGQNHPYDDDVMKRAMQDAGLDPARWSPGGFIDSQALAQSLLDKDSDDYPRDLEKGYKTVSLGPLATWLGHDMGDGWHSADADSEASYEAFKRLIDRAALHEGQGIPVRRDLLEVGGGEKELQERLKGFEKEKSGFDWKVKKYRDQQAASPESPATEGFASRVAGRVRESIDERRRAKDPARWENLTPEQRDAATQESAKAAIDYINALQDLGIDVKALRDMDRAELDLILKDLAPGGEARVSDYVTGDGKALIEVSNATLGQVFMSLGLHVEVISDDPNEHHILENGINDMQKALQNYVASVAKDPDALLNDVIFMDWADKNKINLGGLKDPKKLEKAAKKFAEEFEINMCLYYKAGSNMLCGSNIGIEREQMPQLGGRMKGDDTLAAKAIKSGLMTAKEFQINNDKLSKLDKAKQDELTALAKDPAKVAELVKSKDPLVKELFDVLNWNDTEANLEPIADRAAAALGIIVDKPRFVDPATMLGAQNQLQGSKVENMADGAVKAVQAAIPVLSERLGRKPTQDELMDYLANEIKHGLFQPTLTAGSPGSQTYMLDGHHRWAGLLMANKKLEALGLDVRVQLNIKNYQTDIRSGLELGRAVQVAMGVKDAKLAGEDMFVFDPNAPDLTPEEFDKVISELIDPANLIKKLQEVREGGKFRQTEGFDTPGGQAERLAPKIKPFKRPVLETVAMSTMPDPEPKSRVAGVKPQKKGYRAAGTGNGWTSVEDHIDIETERGNELFETHQEYLDKGYEVAWVTHTSKEAGRYAISADQVNAFDRGEVPVDPANIDPVDLTGAELVDTDGEGGFLYARRKPSPAARKLQQVIAKEEEILDAYESEGFASMGRTNEAIERNKNLSPEKIDQIESLTERIRTNPYASIEQVPYLKRDIKEIFEGDLNIGGKKYIIKMNNYEIDGDENLLTLEFDINNAATSHGHSPGKLASKVIFQLDVRDDGSISINHEIFQTMSDSRNLGIMTEFLARQEALYKQMGVEEITLIAASNKFMNGLTHWARNGYDFSTPEDRKKFINGSGLTYRKGFKKGLDVHRELFSDEEYARLTKLVDDPSATAADLTDFAQAEAYFKITKPYVNMTRKLQPNNGTKKRERELVSASSGDGFASTGETLVPLDVVIMGGSIASKNRGGSKQRDQEVIADDFYTRQQRLIAGIRQAEFEYDENGTPIPGKPIYRENIKIAGKEYAFEVDSDGVVSVYTGRKYKQVAQLTLDRGHTHIGGRSEDRRRHFIENIVVDEKHRRRGIATQMSKIAEHAYGGSVEHSDVLTDAGKAFRNSDVIKRGTPAAKIPGDPSLSSTYGVDGFASRGSTALDPRDVIAGREAAKSPSQIIGEEYLAARLDGYHKFGGNVSNAELNMLAIYKSWQDGDEPWESFVERFPALQSMIKKDIAKKEQQAAMDILEEMAKAPRATMSREQRESSIRRVVSPQLGAANLMAEAITDTGRLDQQRRDLGLQKNYLAWQRSGDTWEKFVEDNPAIEKIVEKERNSGKLNERITRMLKPSNTSPPLLDAGSNADFSLDDLANKLNLAEIETGPDRVTGQLMAQINARIANGDATLAEKLGITPEQLKERLAEIATEINQFVDRFVADKDVRRNVKYGLKLISSVSMLLGFKELKDFVSMLNPNLSGGGTDQGGGTLDILDVVLSAGIHEALIAYGMNFANLIATEMSAMRLVTRQKAKEMIKEIKERIEGTGQYIGTMSNEMWARLRGAWAKVRPTAPIGMPATAKQWIVAGSSPQWAEMSWMDYQSKSRKTNDLLPTDTQRWASIATKVGQSPELIDIASYRAGIGYGDKRIKSRDVVRVYLIAEKSLGQTIGEMSASQSTSSG